MERKTVVLRILIVDDEEPIREIFEAILSDFGHEIRLADSGADALRALRSGDSFDLIFTDLSMPNMSGWDFAEQCRAASPQACIVLVSGWVGDIDERELQAKGVDFALPKPISIVELTEIVEKAQRRTARN
ncbi:MAG: Response regulator receiver protein [candidate division BRC1 bacterium ADurb.BinA364]|nr:MAG: Response regulator receiver protein [candidate division BRC1 bacterium ADurb.BinA364]